MCGEPCFDFTVRLRCVSANFRQGIGGSLRECAADVGNILPSTLSCFDALIQSSEDYDERTELKRKSDPHYLAIALC
ncbi:hypothetical protein RRU01S_27_00700 [Agrobacterium rubi TR3 = NBRC 13261]|uniref:Uncharacterized protein n=1 Tax=Agrobacterium rubi TR3 = NBRC 13261 TaxID=1368415 RepID=A0A081D186_9HYPH|nr:hypothetical protein RRU01S_27_00700 [Agrobacterium rubi TR3 = NBRC 13261]